MSISRKIEIYYKNRVENIRKMKNGIDRDMAIGAFVVDLGQRSIKPLAKAIGSSFRKVKKCFESFYYGVQAKIEFRGRKKVEDIYPEIRSQIKDILKIYEYTDSHFKSETLFVDLTLQNLRNELIVRYSYTEQNCPCRSTLLRLLTNLGYKIQKIKKNRVLDKIPETDTIFENIKETKQFIPSSGDDVAIISIDDKNRKKVGNISDNGYSWFNRQALDHDTNFSCTIVPFGILDLKTNETFVYCNKESSTANFKVDCIDDYLKQKEETFDIKRLIIFLDNGPENSSRRTLWIKCLVDLAKKHYKISILSTIPF